MLDNQDPIEQAVSDLIKLYRSIEHKAVDLSSISLMPLLIYFWSILKFILFHCSHCSG